LVERARELAERAHSAQVRKSGGVPYFTHLHAVAELVRTHGHADEAVVSAAYLHDLLEDQPAFAAEFRREFPDEVVRLVEALSEIKLDAAGRRLPKAERFERYFQGLAGRSEAALRALPVSCADKIDNGRSLIEAEARHDPLLLRLNTRPGEQLSQLDRLRPLYAEVVDASLLAEFDRMRAELAVTIERWLLGRAVMVAAEAHLSQFDRAGEPYILHPLALAARTEDRDERIVALLHDVVEDTPITLAWLAREGFPERVLCALDALTKREGEDYATFIERVAEDRLATRVKLLDLAHNGDLTRLPAPTPADHERVRKYAAAAARLRDELGRRNLAVRLDETSRAALRRVARLAIVRGEHVTLARRVAADADVAALAHGFVCGDTVPLRVVAECADPRVQAFIVEIGGSSRRAWDDGVLHVTVSRSEEARSRDANALLARGPRAPFELSLTGVLEWDDG
jgi:hypothetical protein